MDKIITDIIRSVAYSTGGLFLGAIIMSVILGVTEQIHDGITISRIKSGYGIGIFFSLFVIMAGFIPALMYGAPMYSLTRLYGRASFLLSALIGVAPGIAIYSLSDRASGLLFIIFGLAVGLSTHAIAKATERKQ
ncbi:hypothetical protein [Ectopseudomonas khazarica]|uniref:hypothetical protein n=1 Tax=Ectopseudomonas khazarica TaxID=2502979 RepID=UPI00348984EA